MRFLPTTRLVSLVRGCRDFAAAWRCLSSIPVIVIATLITAHSCHTALSQGPGTPPPESLFAEQPGTNGVTAGGLKVRGFLLLDESGVPVMVPKMTYEQWKELESGLSGTQQSYAFQSMDVKGTAKDGRAELEVTIRFSVDVTDGRQISIPLMMGNFHCVSLPEVTGVDEHSMGSAPDSGGYVLSVRADKKRDAVFKVKVVALVETGTNNSLQFRLPNLPSTVQLDVDGDRVTTEIVGRGDEVLQSTRLGEDKTRLLVESGGGTFLLRWGEPRRQDDTTPQLEIESDIEIRWVAPEDQPTVSVLLVVRNLRGVVSQFDVRLPPGCLLLDAPMLVSSGQYVEVSEPDTSDPTQPVRILIPEEEQQQRIDLKLELQLANANASAEDPLDLQIPDVVGAIRHHGEIQIRTGADYRLRWLSRQWIQSIATNGAEDLSSSRRYTFQFDRGGLSLPIYLSAKERQVRLTSSTEILLSNSLATLEMTINAAGQPFDGRGLNVDLKGWQLRSILDTETGEELEHFGNGPYHEIEMNSGGADESAPVRIIAEHEIATSGDAFSLPLPAIVKTDESQVVKNATILVRSSGREVFVPDLSRSSGLDRLALASDIGPIQPNVHRLRILPPDAPATLSGMMVRQAPRIDLASSATVQLDSNELQTTVDWTITSLVNLEGRLAVEIPTVTSSILKDHAGNSIPNDSNRKDSESSQFTSDSSSGVVDDFESVEPTPLQWNVTVENSAAVLRHVEGTKYELISDRLGEGTCSIRWWQTRTVDLEQEHETMQWIALPRPRIDDISMQGATRVSLSGDQYSDLQAVGVADTENYIFESMPREPLRVRVVRRLDVAGESTMDHAVLRTAIGRNVRYEQLLATVQGDEFLSLGLRQKLGDITVEAMVDMQPVVVHRKDNRLMITLPLDSQPHAVDLRVWIPYIPAPWFPLTEPMIQVPPSVGRVYWQVVSPLDSHVVWAAPTLGRAMNWELRQWRLSRVPLRDDQGLAAWAGIETTKPMPPGNRYLYVGTDLGSFRAVTATRGQLWAIVASIVLAFSALLTYVPRSRHPLSAVMASIALAGLIAIAPDSAVIVGQFATIALALVVVMTSIRALMSPRRGDRVFRPSSSSHVEPSTLTIKQRELNRERRVVRETVQPATNSSSPSPADIQTVTEHDAEIAQPHNSGLSQGSSKLPPPTEVTS